MPVCGRARTFFAMRISFFGHRPLTLSVHRSTFSSLAVHATSIVAHVTHGHLCLLFILHRCLPGSDLSPFIPSADGSASAPLARPFPHISTCGRPFQCFASLSERDNLVKLVNLHLPFRTIANLVTLLFVLFVVNMTADWWHSTRRQHISLGGDCQVWSQSL